MSLIKDKEQFNKFIEILPDLKNDEVYFISLSARNKYLTKEEREFYTLGRTEMFARNIIRKKEDIEYIISKLESSLQYKLTKSKQHIPEKALVIYININPSSMIKAYLNLVDVMNKEIKEIVLALQHGKIPNYSSIQFLDRKLMNSIQTSRSRKIFIDIDFDISENQVNILNEFDDLLWINHVVFYKIQTKSGYHVLLDLGSIRFNLQEVIEKMDNEAKKEKGEVQINKNGMIPVPGTLQAEELVKFI